MRQVEAFRAVMMSGGITAGSRLLNLSQPSVSRLIGDLEREVGFVLFERRGGRLYPTRQADALYEAVRRSFTGLDLLDQAARRIRAHPVGTLRIATLSALAFSVLPNALIALREAYPQVRVTVESLGQRDIEDRVFLGQADLGLGVSSAPREGVRSSTLARAPYLCAMPAGHALAARQTVPLEALAGEDLIGPMHEADALWSGIDDALARAGAEVRRPIESQHSLPVYAFVAAGLGVAIVEPFSAPMFARLGVQVRALKPEIAMEFVCLEPDIGPTSPVVALLRSQAAAAAAACLREAAALCARQPAMP